MLYLNTAGLGRMTPGAQRAGADYGRLIAAEGLSTGCDRFVRSGIVPNAASYPGLDGWRGVAGLKHSLRHLAGGRADQKVLLANRSAELMNLAAGCLFPYCENVLTVDLGWPEYNDRLKATAARHNRCVTEVAIRDAMLRARACADEVVELVKEQFIRHKCDSLFMPAVSNRGPCLPVERIVRAVEAVREVRFVGIDGAQDFCHVSANLRNEYYDLYLTGCHKWLGAGNPMGLAFYGRGRSKSHIDNTLRVLQRSRKIDDPLLRYMPELEASARSTATETVGLIPLFFCHGAVADALGQPDPARRLPQRFCNAAAVLPRAVDAGWTPVVPADDCRSGILLLRAKPGVADGVTPSALRDAFYDEAVVLTAYRDGIVRLSMPDWPWAPGELDHLHAALRSVRDACQLRWAMN